MRRRGLVWVLLIAGLFLHACTLPGGAPPTPFTFPTPDATIAAAFSRTATPTVVVPILPTLEPVPSATITPTVESSLPTARQPMATPTSTTLLVRPNDNGITAARLTTPPTIDGILSEWNTTAYSITSVVYGSGSWSGISDASATFYIAWDANNLYLALRVTDNAIVQISSGRDLYKGDSIELQFDADLPGDFYSATLSSDDYQIGISPGNFSSLSPEAYRWYPSSLRGSLPTVNVSSRQIASGYELEASIPWNTFGLSPGLGNRFGIALSISDNDTSGTADQQSLISHVSTRELLDPTSWGTLILQ